MPVPEDPLVALASGTEVGVSALVGDTVFCGAIVAGAGVCTTRIYGVSWCILTG